HRVAAAVHQEAGLARGDDRGAEPDPGDRAARSPPDPLVERDDAGRAVVALLEAAGDDADDAGMPALAGGEDQGRRAVPALDLGDRGVEDARLDLAALGVVGVELARQPRRLERILGREQARAEVAAPDTAAGVDA